MSELVYSLLSDGPTDRALLPLLSWLLRQVGVAGPIHPQWADLRVVLRSKRPALEERVSLAIEYYPCSLLFVHRDAEGESRDVRASEIRRAIDSLARARRRDVPIVCVIPVKMTEAWLLFDEAGIRRAVGNSHGTMPIQLPQLRTVENLADPKSLLRSLLTSASGLGGRRRERLDLAAACVRVPDFIQDFSPLRSLSAFAVLEAELAAIVQVQGWR